jgi:hypothetical protein
MIKQCHDKGGYLQSYFVVATFAIFFTNSATSTDPTSGGITRNPIGALALCLTAVSRALIPRHPVDFMSQVERAFTAWTSGSYRTLEQAFSHANWGDKTNAWVLGVQSLSRGGMTRWVKILQATRPYTQYGKLELTREKSPALDIDDETGVDYRTTAPDSGTYFLKYACI